MLPGLCYHTISVKAHAFPEHVCAGSAQLHTKIARVIQATKGADDGADPRRLAFSGSGTGQTKTLVADTVGPGPSSRA